jgi:flagellar protein FlbD
MVLVTRLNDRAFVINADLIETVEETPDTVVTLTTGRKYVVRETVDTIVARVVEYRSRCLPVTLGAASPSSEGTAPLGPAAGPREEPPS